VGLRKVLSVRLAGGIAIGLLALLAIVHVLVLSHVIPYEMVWAGRISNESSLIAYETIALVVTLIFLGIVIMRSGYVIADKFKKVSAIGIWVVFAYFVLNAVGNFTSGVSAENFLFGPLTVVLALLSLRVAIGH
jgi:hypothetical protein